MNLEYFLVTVYGSSIHFLKFRSIFWGFLIITQVKILPVLNEYIWFNHFFKVQLLLNCSVRTHLTSGNEIFDSFAFVSFEIKIESNYRCNFITVHVINIEITDWMFLTNWCLPFCCSNTKWNQFMRLTTINSVWQPWTS